MTATIGGSKERIQFFPGGTSAQGSSNRMRCNGGRYLLSVQGTINGASVLLEYLGDDGVTYFPLGAARTTIDSGNTPPGGVVVEVAGNTDLRVTISAATPTALYVSLTRIPGN